MELKNGWTILSEAEELDLKIFKNIQNEDEFVVRDKHDTGALASLIISDSMIDVQEMTWAISLRIDWTHKKIVVRDSEEKKSES